MYDRTILETIDYHRSMLADKVRMRSYLQAIERTVEPGDVVLDIELQWKPLLLLKLRK